MPKSKEQKRKEAAERLAKNNHENMPRYRRQQNAIDNHIAKNQAAGHGDNYIFRSLPCNILPDSHLYCVSGMFTDEDTVGGGVLEWAYDLQDADQLVTMMKKDSRLSNLCAHKYQYER